MLAEEITSEVMVNYQNHVFFHKLINFLFVGSTSSHRVNTGFCDKVKSLLP